MYAVILIERSNEVIQTKRGVVVLGDYDDRKGWPNLHTNAGTSLSQVLWLWV